MAYMCEIVLKSGGGSALLLLSLIVRLLMQLGSSIKYSGNIGVSLFTVDSSSGVLLRRPTL